MIRTDIEKYSSYELSHVASRLYQERDLKSSVVDTDTKTDSRDNSSRREDDKTIVESD